MSVKGLINFSGLRNDSKSATLGDDESELPIDDD